MTIAITQPLTNAGVDGAALARRLRGLRRKGQVKALLLIAPLLIFLVAIFVLPIGVLLTRSLDNREVSRLCRRRRRRSIGGMARTRPMRPSLPPSPPTSNPRLEIR